MNMEDKIMKFTKLDKFIIVINLLNCFICFNFIIFLAWCDYNLYEILVANHSVVYDVIIVCSITFIEILIYNGKILKQPKIS